MRRILLGLLVLLAGPVGAQQAVPEARYAVTRNIDLPGGDIRSLFDSTLDACITACVSDPNCAAFTFNTRSNACFPKSVANEPEAYDGAISARIFRTSEAALDLGRVRAAELDFLSETDLSRARDFAASIGRRHAASENSFDTLVNAARTRGANGEALIAMRFTGAALSLQDRADLWLDYARYASTAQVESGQLREYRNRAVLAATNAYLRAETSGAQVTALEDLARYLEANRRGRDMIPALRLAQSIQPRDDIARALDTAIGKYGFRVVDTQVESDSAEPRICAVFSEFLAPGVDYTPFVALPDARLAVTAEDDQVCVSGVTHGARYALTFREGLPAQSGEVLHKSVQQTLYVRDRTAGVRFPGRAFVLPKTDLAAIPVVTVNTREVDLSLKRLSDRNLLRVRQEGLFGRPLSTWDLERFDSDLAVEVWTGTGTVGEELNRDVTTRLPMAEALADQPPGIYALQASVPGADRFEQSPATQWFVVTDFGLRSLSGADGLTVEARSLADTSALGGAAVTLISRSNTVLAETQTDAEGRARFAPGLMNGQGGNAAALVTVRSADDFAFLSLEDAAFDLSDRGVEGRAPSGAVDVFMTTDRGAYRAGETIHTTILARDGQAQALNDLPITAHLKRPDGVTYQARVSTDARAGGHVMSFPLATTVPRGTWEVAVYGDPDAPPLQTTQVLVEDFVPERIDFDLDLPENLSAGQTAPLTVEGRYLFGAPAANLPLEGEIILRAATEVDGYSGYRFGRHDDPFRPERAAILRSAQTGADGTFIAPIRVPTADGDPRPLNAEVVVRMSEGSARPVERRITRPVAPWGDVIGIRPAFDGVVPEGTEAAFQLVALSPDLQPTQRAVTWTLNRVETRYQWYQLYGDWNWEPVTRRTRIATGEALTSANPVQISAPVDWGRYELIVEADGGAYTASSMPFYAGWYAPAETTDTPDTLQVSLNADTYAVGDIAQLRINARDAGLAVVEVMSNRVLSHEVVEIAAGETLIDVPVTKEWGTGAYVAATLLRPMDVAAGRNPHRALGLDYASVDPGAKQLAVSLDAPEMAQPRGPLEIGIAVDGVASGDTAYVTLAAVDVGVLNITNFQSPDPSDHYFGQHRLGVEIRDLYGRLIDGLNGATGVVRSGGDALFGLDMASPPPTEDVVAFFQGPVPVVDGQADVTLNLPEFNGTLRVMAVAWSQTGVGQAEAEVIVRDPVVLSASLPRFLAPGDQTELALDLTHVEGPVGRVSLDIVADGAALGAFPSGFDLAQDQQVRVPVTMTAGEVGDASLLIRLTTPGGESLTKTLALGIRANDPEQVITRRFALDPGATLTLDDTVLAGFQPGSARATTSFGPLARFDAPRLLEALDRYPYGCTEQMTSVAMPLLYFNAVSSAMQLGDGRSVSERIEETVSRVVARQSSNGSFGLWGVGSGDLWLDAYVTDFLTRAHGLGYTVPDRARQSALDNLRNRVNAAADFDSGGQDLAYALFVLAREGAAATGDLRYYADVKADAFTGPLPKAQLGAALAAYGDQTRADRIFGLAARDMATRFGEEDPVWRSDYGTNRRDAAAVLTLAVESGTTLIDRETLARAISQPGERVSTQEAAWSLLAANAMIDAMPSGQIAIDGAPMTGPMLATYEGDAVRLIENLSDSPTDVTLTTFGVPTVAPPAGGDGYAIERLYFTMEGQPRTLDNLTVGERFVTVLRVTPFGDRGARLMVNDALPAGVEIDNPNLIRSGDLGGLDWLQTARPESTEFRSDRFLAAVDWRSDSRFELAYIARAVSPGSFHYPAASVEDMYRPRYRAWTDAGRLDITR